MLLEEGGWFGGFPEREKSVKPADDDKRFLSLLIIFHVASSASTFLISFSHVCLSSMMMTRSTQVSRSFLAVIFLLLSISELRRGSIANSSWMRRWSSSRWKVEPVRAELSFIMELVRSAKEPVPCMMDKR